MIRVYTLYRVSTNGQVHENDIPLQRTACHQFVERMPGWSINKEFEEKGVSGYKVSAKDRDKITDIRAAAERKEFDVLLVFMFDRLGRKEDETPFVVQWFISKGIQVWSVNEGQQKLENHSDKLLNYIRYWQAEGESIKTSERVQTRQLQLTEDGVWRGGSIPYGYRGEHRGRMAKKNRPLMDLVRYEPEGEIIQFLWDCYCNKGMGTHQLSNLLNDKYPNPKKIWKPTTIRRILGNPIYTGRLHMNEILSPPNEELRYITDTEFDMAQRILKDNISHRREIQVSDDMVSPEKSKSSVYGATLLSGILYCAHCNSKLYGSYHAKDRNYGRYYRAVYRDYNKAIKAVNCEGQATYSAKKVENIVLRAVHQYFDHFSGAIDTIWQEQIRLQQRKTSQVKAKAFRTQLENLNRQMDKLKEEVMKSLMGESPFNADVLREMVDQKNLEIENCGKMLAEHTNQASQIDQRLAALTEQYNNICTWVDIFDGASDDEKRMILARIIERITIDNEYRIKIYFYLALDDFKKAAESSISDGYAVMVEEADRYMETIAK